jgi:hypothetical protein
LCTIPINTETSEQMKQGHTNSTVSDWLQQVDGPLSISHDHEFYFSEQPKDTGTNHG